MSDCPPPLRQNDENYCRRCHMRWESGEDRPPCPRDEDAKSFPSEGKLSHD